MTIKHTFQCGLLTAVFALVPTAFLQAGSWLEAGDAPSYPELIHPQQTTGTGSLDVIFGSIDETAGDPRDAYCIRITDPEAFVATTDPQTSALASASFDTRLFLFNRGHSLLANDEATDTVAVSTLSFEATASWSSSVRRPGEYVLVIGASSAMPVSRDGDDVFSLTDGEVTARLSGEYHDHWSAAGSEVGNYAIALAGVEPCGDLDAVVGPVFNQEARLCTGGPEGSFSCSNLSQDLLDVRAVAMGDLDGDSHLDVVFAGYNKSSRKCFGQGDGSFVCSVLAGARDYRDIVLVDDYNDDNSDILFAVSGEANRYCDGDGTGGFSCNMNDDDPNAYDAVAVAIAELRNDSIAYGLYAIDGGTDPTSRDRVCKYPDSVFNPCVDLDSTGTASRDLAVGRLNDDNAPDVVIAVSGAPNRICTGDYTNFDVVFSCYDLSADVADSRAVAIGDLNGDAMLDVVFGNTQLTADQLCLNQGGGVFACADLPGDPRHTTDLALGDLDADGNLDVFSTNFGHADRRCLGDGSGGFACADVGAAGSFSRGVALGEVMMVDRLFNDGFDTADTSHWNQPALTLGPELLLNPDFESGITSWAATGASSFAVESVEVYAGSGAARSDSRTLAEDGPSQFGFHTTLNTDGPGRYLVSAWVKHESRTIASGVRPNINLGLNSFALDFEGRLTPVTSTWTLVEAIFDLSWSGTLQSATLSFSNMDSDAPFYIDSCSLRRIQ